MPGKHFLYSRNKMRYDNCYFIGIGGIGMSAIARYFNHQGCYVSGYDRTPSPLTAKLEEEGIAIHYEESIEAIPKEIGKTLVIYTPAVPKDSLELTYVQRMGYKVCKRSQALREIADGMECLAVAGTHGKTTTSTLLSHILTSSGEGCNAFLGGISKNYDTNLLLSRNNVLVAEADEFDRSFLQLFPRLAAITATDADHLDIYEDRSNMLQAFGEFAGQVEAEGTLVVKYGVEVPLARVNARVLRYSYDTPCDFYASDIVPLEGGYFNFTLNYPGGKIEDCRVGVPGWVNVENAVAASALAILHGTWPKAVKEALATFSGVKRRFDIHVNRPGCAYVDDYAHHPNEIKAAISSIRNIFPGRKICGVFQPHLYTRTRDFADEFAEALSGLDSLIMLPIYPAREEPIPGVSSYIIFDKVTAKDKVMVEKSSLLETILEKREDCLVTFGAGDIDRFIEPIAEMLG